VLWRLGTRAEVATDQTGPVGESSPGLDPRTLATTGIAPCRYKSR
jgi:hypothetical protein